VIPLEGHHFDLFPLEFRDALALHYKEIFIGLAKLLTYGFMVFSSLRLMSCLMSVLLTLMLLPIVVVHHGLCFQQRLRRNGGLLGSSCWLYTPLCFFIDGMLGTETDFFFTPKRTIAINNGTIYITGTI